MFENELTGKIPRVEKRKGFGLGLVFTSDHAANEKVFTEMPLVSTQDIKVQAEGTFVWTLVEAVLRKDLEEAGLLQYARDIPTQWDQTDQANLERLQRTFPAAAAADIRGLHEVMATNNLVSRLQHQRGYLNGKEITVATAKAHGFYPLLSRANHACKPTAVLQPPADLVTFFNSEASKEQRMCIVTTQAVRAGDELTIDYVQGVAPDEKRTYLFQNHGFRCRCGACALLCQELSCNKRGPRGCSRCQVARYCGREHQRSDWRHHQHECKPHNSFFLPLSSLQSFVRQVCHDGPPS
jgi:hypothetical protein